MNSPCAQLVSPFSSPLPPLPQHSNAQILDDLYLSCWSWQHYISSRRWYSSKGQSNTELQSWIQEQMEKKHLCIRAGCKFFIKANFQWKLFFLVLVKDSACEVSTFAFGLKINVDYWTKDITISVYASFQPNCVWQKSVNSHGRKVLFYKPTVYNTYCFLCC